MIRKIISVCIDNPLMVLVALLFSIVAGVWSVKQTPLDAIPDLSANQVIVMTEWPGRGPQVIEDQITYPLSTNLQGIAHVEAVRASSTFGYSMVQVIFDDATDNYWARTRVLEKLNAASSFLPPGVSPTLGPDGTGVGHIYWYVLHPSKENPLDLAQLRELQDFYVRYQLQSVRGVSEVASVGGFVKEYQIDLLPSKLEALDVSTRDVVTAVQESNADAGGKILEQSDIEYFVRGQGYFKSLEDIEQTVVKTDDRGTPITVADVGIVQYGTELRRGILDENGDGEVVGGVVVMRNGENAREVIDRVKERIEELRHGLPEGVEITAAYDRSELIDASVQTLTRSLAEEAIVVTLIILLFLFHARSSLIVVLTLPVAVLSAFIFMRMIGISSNIMSLGGIAIAVGVIVDAAIVMVENAYQKLAQRGTDAQTAALGPITPNERVQIIKDACKQVGPALFFSMLIIITSFAPVFMLTGQEGKLFTPLAWTKTLTMVSASILAITLVPVLMVLLLRGTLRPEKKNPISRVTIAMYSPVLRRALRHPRTVIVGVLLLFAATIPLFTGLQLTHDGRTTTFVKPLGSEFMPDLDEGDLLYMPVTLPNISMTEAKRLMQVTDKIIAAHPEVEYVLGKVGRAETATDPAPPSMLETTIRLKPRSEWRKGITKDDIVRELDEALQIPGVSNGWTQPIINRINMLATGIHTDLGLKIVGADLAILGDLALEAEQILRGIPGAKDLYAERTTDGYYLNITPDRRALARLGLRIQDVNDIIETAIGGVAVTTSVEGRSRFPVRVRYAQDERSSLEDIRNILLTTSAGAQIPLASVADVAFDTGPPTIESEDGQLQSTVILNVRGRDIGSFIAEAKQALEDQLELPAGYTYNWSGQYENQQRARDRLTLLIPLALALIFLFLYLTFRSIPDALIVMLSVPFALIGGFWLLAFMKLNMSVAVAVGFIALFGLAVETGVVMLLYLNEALHEQIAARCRHQQLDPSTLTSAELQTLLSADDIHEAALHGATLRLRPKLMTAATTLVGLTPLLWATGTGSDFIRPIAVPMVGGMLSSLVLVLFVIPILFDVDKRRALRRGTLRYSPHAHT